jgi:hypothetical protein
MTYFINSIQINHFHTFLCLKNQAEKIQQKYIDNVEKIGYYSDANVEYLQHQALTIWILQ